MKKKRTEHSLRFAVLFFILSGVCFFFLRTPATATGVSAGGCVPAQTLPAGAALTETTDKTTADAQMTADTQMTADAQTAICGKKTGCNSEKNHTGSPVSALTEESATGEVPATADVASDGLSDFSSLLSSFGFPEYADGEKSTEAVGIHAILNDLFLALEGERSGVCAFFLLLLSAFFFLSLAESFSSASENHDLAATCTAALGVLFSLEIFRRLSALSHGICDTVAGVSDFLRGLSPILLSLTAAGGGTVSAGVGAAGTALLVEGLDFLTSSVLLPLSTLLFAFAFLAVFGDGSVGSVGAGVRSLFLWLFGSLTAVFAGALSLQTTLASAKDSALLRAAKYAASSLPLVGSTVTGALGTLGNGLSLASGTVGAGAVAVLLSVSLAPLLRLLLYRLCFSVAALPADFLGKGSAAKLFTGFRAALDCLIAVYVFSLLLCFLQIFLFLRVGGALLS